MNKKIITNMKKSGRAALLALTLGAASVTTMPAPAMAQSEPSFSFQLGIGDKDRGLTLRFGDQHYRDRDRVRFCLTNAEIRRGLRQHGFRNIDILRKRSGNRVDVVASYGKRWYLLRVDRCTGRVRIIERLRRFHPGGGFGLHFNFGM